jgi:polysaccharide export outer membrane protein
MMNLANRLALAVGVCLCGAGATARDAEGTDPARSAAPEPAAVATPRPYVLAANDLVLVKVYRQDDLESRLRISKDGTASFPLLGTVKLGGKTVEEAKTLIRDLLAQDYLVDPQVTVTVLEYAKRRFTVLGQAQKPGSYEIPGEESINLLQAIAMAGGFTRLASIGKITITREVGDKKVTTVLDGGDTARCSSFAIQPEDTITIPQRVF